MGQWARQRLRDKVETSEHVRLELDRATTRGLKVLAAEMEMPAKHLAEKLVTDFVRQAFEGRGSGANA